MLTWIKDKLQCFFGYHKYKNFTDMKKHRCSICGKYYNSWLN